jgi:hypothetical protein
MLRIRLVTTRRANFEIGMLFVVLIRQIVAAVSILRIYFWIAERGIDRHIVAPLFLDNTLFEVARGFLQCVEGFLCGVLRLILRHVASLSCLITDTPYAEISSNDGIR